ncbi:MAG: hypothetical protein KIPDCIKN_00444 [Haliscomenobacter sp.]|jgi:hypothetical protein|nr:hypothetical protein [Haliscomenobacter sp.]
MFTDRIKNIYCSAVAGESPAPADVVVTMACGERYAASFIPYGCIADLLKPKWEGIAYFWAKNLVLVPDCKRDTVEQVVRAMVEEGEVGEGFEKI